MYEEVTRIEIFRTFNRIIARIDEFDRRVTILENVVFRLRER